ncbi:class I SAM-dependent methyltransferase [Patescibacteria group bacterium]|nr:class I SAM-dependent methyltransferase [Patescibacteria group bacterium]
MERLTLTTKASRDYELLDTGREEKLERFGDVLLARPDPQALWEKHLETGEWEKAQGRFERKGKEGVWHENNLPKEWSIEFGGLNFLIKPTSFKHTGLFPEQLPNWEWVAEIITSQKPSLEKVLGGPRFPSETLRQTFSQEVSASSELVSAPSVLNLFGYTGGATLAAAKAGANVTHVDASKTAVAWGRQNAELSGLKDAPIRWIIEDALTFVKREIRRLAENVDRPKYDGVIMDPPAFGHGPDGELWKIEEDFLELLKLLPQLLSDKPLFVLINGYAAGYSPLAFAYNLEQFEKQFGGSIEYGDLSIEEKAHSTGSGQGSGRTLPCGIFARWVR